MKNKLPLSLLSILMFGTTFLNQINAQAYAGIDLFICADSAYLDASDAQTGTQYWSVIQGGGEFVEVGNPQTLVRHISRGENVFRWNVIEQGVLHYDDVLITNNTPYALANDISTCLNSAFLVGNDPDPGEGLWTKISGAGTIVSPTLYSSEVIDLLPSSTSKFQWKVTVNGCSDSIVIRVIDHKFAVSAGDDASVCSDTYTLQGTHPATGTGSWSVLVSTGIFDNPTLNTATVRNLYHGENVLKWTVSRACTATSANVVITNNSPDKAEIIEITPVSNFTELTVLANNPVYGTGMWSITSGPQNAVIVNPSNYQTQITGLQEDDVIFLRWTVSTEQCSDFEEIKVELTTYPVYAGADVETCDSVIQLSARYPLGANAFWSVISGSGSFENQNLWNTTVGNLSACDNIFRWSVINPETQLIEYDDVLITYKGFSVDAGEDQTLSLGTMNTTLLASPGLQDGATGKWDVVSGSGLFDYPNQAETPVSQLSTGTNTFRWTMYANGCSSYDTVNIYAEDFCAGCGPSPIYVCKNSAELPGVYITGAESYWSLVQGSGDVDDMYSPTTLVSKLEAGTNIFRLNYIMETYYTYQDYAVIYNEIEAIAGPDQVTCANEVEINAAILNPGETGEWTIVSGFGTIDEPTNNVTMLRDFGAATVVRWTVTSGDCTDFDDMLITLCSKSSEIKSNRIHLYPNPSSGFVTLFTDTPIESGDIQTFNTLGQEQKLNWKNTNSNTLNADTNLLPSGIYFIKVENQTLKLIIK